MMLSFDTLNKITNYAKEIKRFKVLSKIYFANVNFNSDDIMA